MNPFTWLASKRPKKEITNRLTTVDTRSEPEFTIRGLTVDVLHDALRNAERGYTRDLFAVYRDIVLADAHLQAEFAKRKLAVMNGSMRILSAEKSKQDPAVELIETTTGLGDSAKSQPGRQTLFFRACVHLLDSTLYPVSLVEKVFRQDGTRYILDDIIPVPHHLLDFQTGSLRVYDVDAASGMVLSSTHEADPDRYIIHRGNLLTFPDNWGGPMRSILFWSLLAFSDREWWGRALERFGAPWLLGKYDASDNESATLLQRAFKLSTRLGGLVVPRTTMVEIQQAAANQTGESFERFMSLCDAQRSKIVIGQTLSADAKSQGLGSGDATLHGLVREDIRAFDSSALAVTLRDQLFRQCLDLAGVNRPAPIMSFGNELSPERATALGNMIESFSRGGLEPTDDSISALSDRTGLQWQRTQRQPAALQTLSARVPYAFPSIAEAGAADLARAMSMPMAAIRKIVLASESPEQCERQILAYLGSDFDAATSAQIVSDALTAYALDGSVV